MKRTALEYVRDILGALEKSQEFTQGMEYSSFVRDERTIFAVTRALEIVGEATKGVSDEVRARCADVPWRVMAGMRDVLIHAYFHVDVEVVWKTAKESVPQAMPALRRCL